MHLGYGESVADRWDPRPSGEAGRRPAPARWSSGSFSRGGRGSGRAVAERPPPAPPRERQAGRFAVGPGYPWPLVSVAALLVVALLAWFLLHRAGLLGLLFPVGYLVACVVAVCAARPDGLVVPALQPPLLAFLALAISTIASGDATVTTMFALGVFAPLAQLFWWMLVALLACVLLGFLRARDANPGFSVRGALRSPGNA